MGRNVVGQIEGYRPKRDICGVSTCETRVISAISVDTFFPEGSNDRAIPPNMKDVPYCITISPAFWGVRWVEVGQSVRRIIPFVVYFPESFPMKDVFGENRWQPERSMPYIWGN